MLKVMNLNEKHTSDLAFVTGYIGQDRGGQARIPTVPRAGHSYFITNLSDVAQAALAKGWIPIMNMCENTATYIDSTQASKPLKVFPQQFVSRVSKQAYRFMVWYDNKFDVNVAGVSDAVAQWNPNHALLMHRHPFLCCGADVELKESMKHHRYKLQEKQYVKYMEEEARAGFPAHGERHFQCGFLLYRLDHPDCAKIQNMWMAHIKRCGIECQISMYYVAQRFPDSIGEYKASIAQAGAGSTTIVGVVAVLLFALGALLVMRCRRRQDLVAGARAAVLGDRGGP